MKCCLQLLVPDLQSPHVLLYVCTRTGGCNWGCRQCWDHATNFTMPLTHPPLILTSQAFSNIEYMPSEYGRKEVLDKFERLRSKCAQVRRSTQMLYSSFVVVEKQLCPGA